MFKNVVIIVVSSPFILIGFVAAFIKESVIFGGELHSEFSQWFDK
jgi:hypothetical protein